VIGFAGGHQCFSARVGLFKTNLTERSPRTNDMMNVRSLVEKSADADLLREMIGLAAERLMELEVGSATGADFGVKNSMRLAQRNGYRDIGRRGLAPSSFAFRSCAKAATFRASLNRAAWQRKL
jgi:hypothetical protein